MSDNSDDGQAESELYQQHDDHIYSDRRGFPAFAIGVVIFIYYRDGKSDEKLAVRLKILEDFIDLCESSINAMRPLNSPKAKTADRSAILKYFSATSASPKTKLGIISAAHLRKGRQYGEPQSHMIEISAGTSDSCLSQIVCYLPGRWFDPSDNEQVVEIMRRWGTWVGAAHGTAGLGLQFNWAGAHQGIETAYPYLRRHPGLEFGDRNLWLIEVERRKEQSFIRSTNWLSLIDDGFVETLGGRAALENRLGPECPIHDFEGGIVIQAGQKPGAGDINHGLIPTAYRTVARALKPIRYESFQSFGIFDPPEPLDPLTESLAWVRRFD